MEIKNCDTLDGVKLIKLKKFDDNRGSFITFPNMLDQLPFKMVQTNISISHKGVLRGMHHQVYNPQTKLVTCLNGAVLDMVYDNRPESPTYKKGKCYMLHSPNECLLVPRGFLHGFISLKDNTIFQYYVDNEYNPNDEATVHWSIMDEVIPWSTLNTLKININNLIISNKDNVS